MGGREEAIARLKENMLSAMVDAARQGHDLGEWKPVTDSGLMGHEAVCSRCGMSVYASWAGVYSILDERCPGKRDARCP